ncbi:hypothetical protein [Bifidobacterium vansinderenii]|uniref:hypothetical protein n=1 Tax=Bifidobacterium vansinderenii TaxID=1984871 RepID=UPI001303622C|nr:hypothetical protein [Bifidobacterium vansinderenii]
MLETALPLLLRLNDPECAWNKPVVLPVAASTAMARSMCGDEVAGVWVAFVWTLI